MEEWEEKQESYMNLSKIVNVNGYKKIQIGSEIFEPIMYRSFRPSRETVAQFYSAGCRLMMPMISGLPTALGIPYSLFGEFWLGEGSYDFDAIDAQLDMFINSAPDAFFALMIQLDTRDWYINKNENAVESFRRIRSIAGDEKWRASVCRMIKDVIAHVEEKYPNKLFCIYLAAGGTCEWMTRDTSSPAPPMERELFVKYCAEHGIKDSEFPTYFSPKSGEMFDPVQDAAAVNVWKFRNETVCDALLHFAAAVKAATDRKLLTGAFFGYVAEGTSLNNNHLYFNKLLASKDIDIISAPASYTFRKLKSISAEMPPVDSITLSEKLYFHEIDQITRFAKPDLGSKESTQYFMKFHPSFDTDEDVINYYKREMACAISRRQGFWWFDMFGGWYDDERMLGLFEDMLGIYKRLSAVDTDSAAEIAVVTDLRSAPYNRGMLTGLLCHQRENLGRLGCPVDYYLSEDLLSESFPTERTKLFIFVNLTYPTEAIKNKIDELRKMNKSILFFSAAGYITDEGFDIDSSAALTGASPDMIRQSISEGTAPIENAEPIIINESGERFDAWCARPSISCSKLRRLAKKAGVKIYGDDNLPIYANSSFFAIFSNEKTTASVKLEDTAALSDLFTGERMKKSGEYFEIPLLQNECRMLVRVQGNDDIDCEQNNI